MKAGLTQAEMDKMSLSELQKAVDKAKNKTEIEKTIADIKVLNPNATGSNGTALSDMTLDELKALLSALQQERATLEASAKAAGMTADEIKKYPSNAALQQVVNEKQKAQRDALIKEILAMEGHPSESELQGKTLDELKAIKAQLTEQAAQRRARNPVAPVQHCHPQVAPAAVTSGGTSAEQVMEKVSSHRPKMSSGFFQPAPAYLPSRDSP